LKERGDGVRPSELIFINMKTTVFTIILIFLFGKNAFTQSMPNDSLYLGQTPPGNTPVVFNLAVDPDFFDAERIAISNDGSEIYYSEVKGYYPINTPKIKKYTYTGNHWTGPDLIFDGYFAAGLSVTGDTMFVQNNSSAYETFISVRSGQNWSTPQRILAGLNSAHYLQVTNSGNYYISSIPDSGIGSNDWCRLLINGTDSTVNSFGLPLNTTYANLDFFIARDESFMIITRPPSVGLSVSYNKGNGSWTNPKSLGSAINFGAGMWGPFVTSDNKYLFYTTGTNPDYSNTHVHWVSVESLIDSLMYTNYVPYVKNKIADQEATRGVLFDFTIPDSTFIDDDGNNTLTYDAKLINGTALPEWLTFDTITAHFSGIPDASGILNIRITATDTAGASVSTTFKIIVGEPTGTGQPDKQGVRIFPNPTTGKLRILTDPVKEIFAAAEISTLAGRVVGTFLFKTAIDIDLGENPKGLYLLKLKIDDEIILRKICIY